MTVDHPGVFEDPVPEGEFRDANQAGMDKVKIRSKFRLSGSVNREAWRGSRDPFQNSGSAQAFPGGKLTCQVGKC